MVILCWAFTGTLNEIWILLKTEGILFFTSVAKVSLWQKLRLFKESNSSHYIQNHSLPVSVKM